MILVRFTRSTRRLVSNFKSVSYFGPFDCTISLLSFKRKLRFTLYRSFSFGNLFVCLWHGIDKRKKNTHHFSLRHEYVRFSFHLIANFFQTSPLRNFLIFVWDKIGTLLFVWIKLIQFQKTEQKKYDLIVSLNFVLMLSMVQGVWIYGRSYCRQTTFEL